MKYNIYGSRDSAVLFLLKNKNIEINKFIDGKISQKSLINFNFADQPRSYDVLPLKYAQKELKKFYTIVATSGNAYWEVKNILEKMGFVEFENFEFYGTFKKKFISVTYGNCNAFGVRDLLLSNNRFAEKYGFYPVEPICELNNRSTPPLQKRLSHVILDKCDLFLYQDIRENNSYGLEYATKPIIKKLNQNCKKICLPNFVNLPKFLFPQIYEHVSPCLNNGVPSPFNVRDFYIDKFHCLHSIEQMTRTIQKKDIIDHQFIKDLLDEFSEKIKCRENSWSIKVRDFIFSTYKKEQLFFDPYHPTKLMLSFIANESLKLLGFLSTGFDSYNYEKTINNFSEIGSPSILLDSTEIPVYYSVKKTLNLQWSNEILCRSFSRNYCMDSLLHPRSTLEYVRDYLMWNYLLIK